MPPEHAHPPPRLVLVGEIETVLVALAVPPWQETVEDMAPHPCPDVLQPPDRFFQLACTRVIGPRYQQHQITILRGDRQRIAHRKYRRRIDHHEIVSFA